MQMSVVQARRVPASTPQLFGSTFLCEAPRQLVLEGGFEFHHGDRLMPFAIVYETYGRLAPDGSNAILVCHALSPGAHAAGKYAPTDQATGWWDGLIGHGKGIDLDDHFVVCV